MRAGGREPFDAIEPRCARRSCSRNAMVSTMRVIWACNLSNRSRRLRCFDPPHASE
jgi:hypothetical protein